jgi:hypothetical protein
MSFFDDGQFCEGNPYQEIMDYATEQEEKAWQGLTRSK